MRINYKEHGRQYNLKSVNTKTETMCRRIYMNRQCLNLSAGFRYTKTWISQLQL